VPERVEEKCEAVFRPQSKATQGIDPTRPRVDRHIWNIPATEHCMNVNLNITLVANMEGAMNFAKLTTGACAVAILFGLAACDNGPSAVRSRDRDGAQASNDNPTGARSDDGGGGSASSERRGYRDNATRSTPKAVDIGGNQWAGSSKYPPAESADYHFRKDGHDFGARDVNDYVAKAHAFVSHPPQGTQTQQTRNGDTLFYDPKNNVFAVATRDGAPRTMFKPRDGAAYWEQQKSRESGRSERPRGNDDQG
jgi:hypothetical protein